MIPFRRNLLGAALTLALAAAPAESATGDISTVAGTGTAGFAGDGGPATSAQLNFPRAVALRPGGGFLIADRENNRVRSVAANGTIATVAGSGPIGAENGDFSGDGGPATSARLDFIHDAVPTPDGGFLISDTRNQRVRYVSPAGTIRTVAGSGPFGTFGSGGFSGDGGSATDARLRNPHGIAVNPDGSYLIADTDNNRVRRVTPGADGVVDGDADELITTVAGSGATGSSGGAFEGDGGPATEARLRRPFEVEPTGDGGFLITDTGNQVIRRVLPGADGIADGDADELITTVAGTPGQSGFSGDGGPATEAELDGPQAAVPTVDGGFLIADWANNRVRAVSHDGVIDTVAGSGPTGPDEGGYGGDGGSPLEAQLNQPKGVAVTAGGDFLIVDEANHRIRLVEGVFAPAGPTITDTDPDSPANDNNPEVKGTVGSGSPTQIELYKNATCSGTPDATGPVAEFTESGITVNVIGDATTTLSARATDAAGNDSTCSNSFDYTEDSTAPAGPTITDTDPDSPGNDNNPEVKGSAEAESSVKLYESASCGGAIEAQGSATTFASPGLTASVANDATVTFTATATDAAGNTSTCSNSFDYTEDSALPMEQVSPPAEQVSPPGIGLELVVEAKRKQEPVKLSVKVTCPQEGCTVAGEGKAKDGGAKSKLKPDGAQLQPGETEKLKLTPKEDIRELRGGEATIGVLATDADGDRASKQVKVKLKG